MNKRTKKWLMYGGAGLAALWLLKSRRRPLGPPISVWPTYYMLADERRYAPGTVPLMDRNGNLIASVSQSFMTDFCMEGSGKLRDGRVINISTVYNPDSCSARVLDPAVYPWGKGVQDRPIHPLRSIAVDRHVIPYGSQVYIREFDGLQIPAVDGIGGFTHDGWFSADDTGGAIIGDHIDIFAGTANMWHALEPIIRTRSRLTAHVTPPGTAG